MSFPAGAEYDGYRWLCAQDACVQVVAWQPDAGDFCFSASENGSGPLRLVAEEAEAIPAGTAELCFYPRLDQLKTRCQRRLNTSWRLAQERFEQWMVEQAFFETEEEAWLRFLCHLHEAEVPPPRF
jgi:hypothetical protein